MSIKIMIKRVFSSTMFTNLTHNNEFIMFREEKVLTYMIIQQQNICNMPRIYQAFN